MDRSLESFLPSPSRSLNAAWPRIAELPQSSCLCLGYCTFVSGSKPAHVTWQTYDDSCHIHAILMYVNQFYRDPKNCNPKTRVLVVSVEHHSWMIWALQGWLSPEGWDTKEMARSRGEHEVLNHCILVFYPKIFDFQTNPDELLPFITPPSPMFWHDRS